MHPTGPAPRSTAMPSPDTRRNGAASPTRADLRGGGVALVERLRIPLLALAEPRPGRHPLARAARVLRFAVSIQTANTRRRSRARQRRIPGVERAHEAP